MSAPIAPAGRLLARFPGAPAPDGRALQLFCFPFAGGGAQLFRPWAAALPAGITVTGVCLPGREGRFREPVLASWREALAVLEAAIAPEAGRGPYAFFGHSLGARLAYELTHRLAAGGHPAPELLAVSGCRAPSVPAATPTMHLMDGPALRDRLRELNGVPAEVLASAEMMALLEPTLRADLRLAETWEPTPGRITAPVLALCGEHDILDPPRAMTAWRDHTSGGFTFRAFPAGHFFLTELRDEVLAVLAARLLAGGAP
jgi:medium-chain acyl-[acyl-carrier-protein] hydrolase